MIHCIVSEEFPSVRETPKQDTSQLPEATGTKFPTTDHGRAYPKPWSSDGSCSDESWAYKAHSSQKIAVQLPMRAQGNLLVHLG
ncbi:hypothetical protein X801_07420 [Opisthorchis viverrini]|uniref:Uncharacterized protein n=1 Tax=Opisthorchis viverrini TaxID=6198 RepID=A0A1S8WQS6_OPIVI|nr:hypothetical protein X801_07420 [Opisthorchis viverrini]